MFSRRYPLLSISYTIWTEDLLKFIWHFTAWKLSPPFTCFSITVKNLNLLVEFFTFPKYLKEKVMSTVSGKNRVKNGPFSENLTWFVFLKHSLWDSLTCHITDDALLRSASCYQYRVLARNPSICKMESFTTIVHE